MEPCANERTTIFITGYKYSQVKKYTIKLVTLITAAQITHPSSRLFGKFLNIVSASYVHKLTLAFSVFQSPAGQIRHIL